MPLMKSRPACRIIIKTCFPEIWRIRRLAMKRIAVIILSLTLAFAMCGCFLLKPSSGSRHKLTTYFDDNAVVVNARVFARDKNGKEEYFIKEVEADRLDDLVEEIDKTRLVSHFAHTDYFYKGWYGIELELDDGTYLIYDCTELEHTGTPFDEKESRYDSIEDRYLEDSGKDFWDRIEEYFPGMEEYDFSYGW